MRILALDIGSKTIGIAVSDPMGWTAQGIKTIRRRREESDFQEIKKLAQEFEVDQLLVGLPLNMNGSEGPQSVQMRQFADRLHEAVGLPVILWDERLTTVAADEFLRDAEVPHRKRRQVIDKMAAVFILQGYLENQRKGS